MNTIESYTDGMKDDMELICRALQSDSEEQEAFISNFVTIRSDVVAVTTYNAEGGMESCWSDGLTMKSGESVNLSQGIIQEDEKIHLSQPHVESLFENYYPWVVTAYRTINGRNGELIQVSMDLRFSGIANYVDDVGIGKHGYCFVMDTEGNLIYHPQQQLIYSGLKSERTGELQGKEDGYYAYSEVIYTVRTLENSSWRVVGVSYVDEMITNRVASMVRVLPGHHDHGASYGVSDGISVLAPVRTSGKAAGRGHEGIRARCGGLSLYAHGGHAGDSGAGRFLRPYGDSDSAVDGAGA